MPLGAVVGELGGPLVAYIGAPAPEVVPLDVGNGDTDAEVMEVVGGAELGDRRAGQGGDRVEIRTRREPGGQLGAGVVPADRTARDAQDRRLVVGRGVHPALTSFGGAQEAPSSE